MPDDVNWTGVELPDERCDVRYVRRLREVCAAIRPGRRSEVAHGDGDEPVSRCNGHALRLPHAMVGHGTMEKDYRRSAALLEVGQARTVHRDGQRARLGAGLAQRLTSSRQECECCQGCRLHTLLL